MLICCVAILKVFSLFLYLEFEQKKDEVCGVHVYNLHVDVPEQGIFTLCKNIVISMIHIFQMCSGDTWYSVQWRASDN